MQSFGTTDRLGHNSDAFYERKLFSKGKGTMECVEENSVPKSKLNRIYNHSSEDMRELPDNSTHLMVTSPPYNVGKDYDKDMTEQAFREMLRTVFAETYRVLVSGGRACVNIANVGRKPYLPMHAWIIQDMAAVGFLMRGEIIWDKGASAGTSCAWGSWRSPSNPVLRDVHEYILVFCKGSFARKKPENKQPTISKKDFLAWTKSVWRMPAASAKATGHPAPFPTELPMRLIQLYTYQGDLVLDPFMGGGGYRHRCGAGRTKLHRVRHIKKVCLFSKEAYSGNRMNDCLLKLFENDQSITLLQAKLPLAFEMANMEMPKGNPAVGIVRENILMSFLTSQLGTELVTQEESGTARGSDLLLCGQPLSIKTTTGNGGIKVLWTVDPLKIGEEIALTYQPDYDIILVCIFWGKNKESVFYIPKEVQRKVMDEVGRSSYLDAKVGTNHRGVSIASPARTKLLQHEETLKIKINWIKHKPDYNPCKRWDDFWMEAPRCQ